MSNYEMMKFEIEQANAESEDIARYEREERADEIVASIPEGYMFSLETVIEYGYNEVYFGWVKQVAPQVVQVLTCGSEEEKKALISAYYKRLKPLWEEEQARNMEDAQKAYDDLEEAVSRFNSTLSVEDYKAVECANDWYSDRSKEAYGHRCGFDESMFTIEAWRALEAYRGMGINPYE